MWDTLAQTPPGLPKPAPLPPLPHQGSELPERSPCQEQQQGRRQAWGDTGVRGAHGGLWGCWVGTQVGVGQVGGPSFLGGDVQQGLGGQGQDTGHLGRGSGGSRGSRGPGMAQMSGGHGEGGTQAFWEVQGIPRCLQGFWGTQVSGEGPKCL